MRMGRKAIGRTFEVLSFIHVKGKKVPIHSKVVCSDYNEKEREYLVIYEGSYGYTKGLFLRLVKED